MQTARNHSFPPASSSGSPVSRALSLLGTACGCGAAILLTPLLYGVTKAPLYSYLSNAYGETFGSALTWLVGGIEAVLIYVGIKLLITTKATSAIASMVARHLPHS